MRLWTVHEPRAAANAEARADSTIFIKDGFSWPGLIIPLFWLLYRRLWTGTLVFAALTVIAALAAQYLPLSNGAGFLLALLANLYVGLEGNDLRRRKLAKLGFVQTGSVMAKDREEAELAYFAGRASAPVAMPQPARPVHTPKPGAHGVLGLFPEPGGPR